MIRLRTPSFPLLLLALLLFFLLVTARREDEESKYQKRDFHTLSNEDIRTLVESDPPQWNSVDEGHLGKLLIPRASGSQNNTLVQNYISSVFTKLGWHEEKTPFRGTTPIGDIDFTNLIYTFDPSAPRKIILAAHFDSKWFPDFPANQFIGATDSAAPVAMILDLAEFLTPLLEKRKERIRSGQGILKKDFDEEEVAETTIQIVLFDGEEAFKDWTSTDSIYGARHLAELWQSTYLPSSHPLNKRRLSPPPSVLNTIDHLVLLDLLGNKHSMIYSYFRETDWLHSKMKFADERLQHEGLVEVEKNEKEWFGDMRMRGGIGDDHLPFLHRGVSIFHVISNPFPKVWHTLADDASALSLPALRRWNRILRVFSCEYLGLEPSTTNVKRKYDELVRIYLSA
ncbi:glutaminyl cyclase [Kwoniella mangroviensis CBS 10435]|uniref:Peptide hydrolase n=1 Tax=Kwoniella mangroviensis CBS 10435 TaxID=1331196 RepID=A0A1B9IQY4_9TREE|nr:glutaminyl cyclase [Kwoniella mangroviensis CBS 8507]OCF57966.1 glutaminyl cyclase [Kwoniella mangroviensis CBS 10435]OCF68256.1 glutaminyl cyclase [Kwoniella mangroviensis CBS 8507]OCF74932.1 glutaminyl cyclase [Kwoniella mangroviensis CBS 8886]